MIYIYNHYPYMYKYYHMYNFTFPKIAMDQLHDYQSRKLSLFSHLDNKCTTGIVMS